MSASKACESSAFESALGRAELEPETEAVLRGVRDNEETLTEFKIVGDCLGAAGAQALACALQTNTIVHTLHLYNNRIANAGAQAVAHALQTNTAVHTLNLEYNQIADAGAQALARALEINTTVHTLQLNDNRIADAGAQALAHALETNTTVHTLNLDWNQIADAGAQALARALETNTTVHTLKLLGNRIADAGAQAFARALETNTTVHALDLGINRIADAGVQALARALETNTTLHTLNLHETEMTDAGAQALARAVWRSRLQPGGLVHEARDANGNIHWFEFGLPDVSLGNLLSTELPAEVATQDDEAVLKFIGALRQHFMCLHTAYLFGFARDRPAVLAAYRRDVLHNLVERMTDDELPLVVRQTWQNGTNSAQFCRALTSHPMYTVDVGAIILEYVDECDSNRGGFNWLRQLKTEQSSSSSSVSSSSSGKRK